MINNKNNKHTLFVDNTTNINNWHKHSSEMVIKVITEFGNFTGLKLNKT